MKFWISKNSEVSVRQQIVVQVRLGVFSRDLLPGEKLPSTRELARRFGIHANTVSAAFRELALEGLVVFRKGSGVFVAEADGSQDHFDDIDELLTAFVTRAGAVGFSNAQIDSAIDRWRSRRNIRQLVVVEPDPGLRSILVEEIREVLKADVAEADTDEFRSGGYDRNALVVALPDEKSKLHSFLEPGQRIFYVEANSVPRSLVGSEKPESYKLIAVVSGWAQFLEFARVYLLAAKIDPETLILRSTAESNWRSGVDVAAIIVCDTFTARGHFSQDPRVRIFRLITDSSMDALKNALT